MAYASISQAHRLGVILITVTSALWMSDASLAETRFTILSSASNSWVPHGLSDYTVTEFDGWEFTAQTNTANNWVRVHLAGPGMPPAMSVDYWTLEFEAPQNGILGVGEYEATTRSPFKDPAMAGMSLSSTGRGSGESLTDFVIREISFGPGTAVNSFSVDFVYYESGNRNQPTLAELRYNVIPEPSSAVLLTGAVGIMLSTGRNWGSKAR